MWSEIRPFFCATVQPWVISDSSSRWLAGQIVLSGADDSDRTELCGNCGGIEPTIATCPLRYKEV
jgi:hypothetical protein